MFIVSDSQTFSHIIENMSEIEQMEKKKKDLPLKTCKRSVADEKEMNKFSFYNVSGDIYICKC